ncbi:hypothetical protein L4D76_12315 [Photobacterium sagamiensis]
MYNWLQYFDEQTIRQEFTKAGLNVVELYDVAGTPFTGNANELAIVASK